MKKNPGVIVQPHFAVHIMSEIKYRPFVLASNVISEDIQVTDHIWGLNVSRLWWKKETTNIVSTAQSKED